MNIELPLDGKQRTQVRPTSKALFHSAYALEAFLLIAQVERFYKAQVAEITGCQPSFASSFIKRLEDAALVEPVPAEEGQRRHYLRKAPSPLWGTMIQLTEALLSEEFQASAQVTHLRS
jgi:DNA-binding transcriptional regulator GbsR (MarR family)